LDIDYEFEEERRGEDGKEGMELDSEFHSRVSKQQCCEIEEREDMEMLIYECLMLIGEYERLQRENRRLIKRVEALEGFYRLYGLGVVVNNGCASGAAGKTGPSSGAATENGSAPEEEEKVGAAPGAVK
jgi:hypothetical protein